MKIKLNTKIYPLEAIINTCYDYLDRVYFYLDGNAGKVIEVSLEPKNNISKDKIKNSFLNDLIHATLRHQLSQANKKITEYIVKRALYSAVNPAASRRQKDRAGDDPLGIAIPWEEKYGKNVNSKLRGQIVNMRFNSSIYPKAAILKTASVYAQAGAIKIQKSGDYYLVSMKYNPGCLDSKIKSEFANYALGMAKKCR